MLFWTLAALLLALVFPPSGQASPLFENVGGVGGLGGQMARHMGASAASAYFNPALLPDAPAGLTLGAMVTHSEYGVRLGLRSAAAAVPDGMANAVHADGTPLAGYGLSTDFLNRGRLADELSPAFPARPRQSAGSGHDTIAYEMVGTVLKLFDGHIALGVMTLIPNHPFTGFRTSYADEREQYFSNSLHPELYGDRMRALSMASAMGVRITDDLSLGVGITLGMRALTDAPAYVADAGRLQDVQVNMDTRAKLTVVPHFGLSWRALRKLHLTATLHAPQQVKLKAGFKYLLATGIEQSSTLAFNFAYLPWQAGLGAGWDFWETKESALRLTASLLYARWSRYVDRHAERPLTGFSWGDTLTAAAGVLFRKDALSLSVDGQYKPTPVPEQRGRSNYVDNDRLGSSVTTSWLFRVFNTDLTVGLQLQAHRLLTRSQVKIVPNTRSRAASDASSQLVIDEVPDDAVISGKAVAGREGVQTNNPGWPGFSSGGWIGAASLYLTVAL